MKNCKYFKFSNFTLEFFGSFFLVFFAAGAVMANFTFESEIGPLMGGFSSGIILFLIIFALGKYSRGHVNPGVSYMEYRMGYIKFNTFLVYSFFQILGSIAAGFSLKLIIGNVADVGSNLPLLKSEHNILISFVTEFILSFLLASVIILVAYIQKLTLILLALSVGLVVCVEVIVFGGLTGAAMNPVRAVGPHLAAGLPGNLWIYIVGPMFAYFSAIELFILKFPNFKTKNTTN